MSAVTCVESEPLKLTYVAYMSEIHIILNRHVVYFLVLFKKITVKLEWLFGVLEFKRQVNKFLTIIRIRS